MSFSCRDQFGGFQVLATESHLGRGVLAPGDILECTSHFAML